MQILLACAKTMGHTAAAVPAVTQPAFAAEAAGAVRQLLALGPDALARALHVSGRTAAESALRLHRFLEPSQEPVPAVLAYTGIVFRYLHPETFTAADFSYAQRHLFITSFLYGLLRPLDGIRPYRLEGNVRLPDADGPTRFAYWQPRLTDLLIKAVQADVFAWYRTLAPESVDLILCNPPYLTAAEMAARMPETAHEPALALDGGPDGLAFYRLLTQQYRAPLRPGGWLVVEIGCAQAAAVLALGRQYGWQNGACRQDYGGNDRVILLQTPEQTT